MNISILFKKVSIIIDASADVTVTNKSKKI